MGFQPNEMVFVGMYNARNSLKILYGVDASTFIISWI